MVLVDLNKCVYQFTFDKENREENKLYNILLCVG